MNTVRRPGCRCQQCWGIKETVEEITGHEHRGLDPAPGCMDVGTLHVLTFGDPPDNIVTLPVEQLCDGTMLCNCDRCEQDRADRVRQGPHLAETAQPWQPRPPRHLRQAA